MLLYSKDAVRMIVDELNKCGGARNYIHYFGLYLWMDLFELMPFGLQTIMIAELAGLRTAPQPSSFWQPTPKESTPSIHSQAVVQSADYERDFDVFIPKPHNNDAAQQWVKNYDNINLTSKIKGWLNFFDGKSLADISKPKTTPENIKLTQDNMAKIAHALEQGNYEAAGKSCLEELSRAKGPKNYIEQYGIYFWMRLFKLMAPKLKERVIQDLAGLLSPKQQAVAATAQHQPPL